MKFFKQLFCKHQNVKFVRNIYGDAILHSGGKRSIWKCVNCGRQALKDNLEYPA